MAGCIPLLSRTTPYTQLSVKRSKTPYNICLIELDEQEGLRMVSNILGIVPNDIYIGMPVEVAFLATVDDPKVFLPMFVPMSSTGGIDTRPLSSQP